MITWTDEDDAIVVGFHLQWSDEKIARSVSGLHGQMVTARAVGARRRKLGLYRKTGPQRFVPAGWPSVPDPDKAEQVLLPLIAQDLKRIAAGAKLAVLGGQWANVRAVDPRLAERLLADFHAGKGRAVA